MEEKFEVVTINSKGKILTSSDEVLFDSEDFKTLANKIDELNSTSYSDVEKVVGKWFGKALYSKTLYVTEKGYITFDMTNIENIWSDQSKSFMYAYNTYGADNQFVSLNYPSTAGAQYIADVLLLKSTNQILLTVGSSWSLNYAYITLLYTKITD